MVCYLRLRIQDNCGGYGGVFEEWEYGVNVSSNGVSGCSAVSSGCGVVGVVTLLQRAV